MATVRTNFLTFDQRALRFETQGSIFDEGPTRSRYDAPGPDVEVLGLAPRCAGRGARERRDLGVRDRRHASGYANLPVVLTNQLTPNTRCSSRSRIRSTTYVRAIMRTQLRPAACDDLRRPSVPRLDCRAEYRSRGRGKSS